MEDRKDSVICLPKSLQVWPLGILGREFLGVNH